MLSETDKAYRDELKAQGRLAEDYRDDWALPKKLRPGGGRKSKAKDKAAVESVLSGSKGPIWEEMSGEDGNGGDDRLGGICGLDSVDEAPTDNSDTGAFYVEQPLNQPVTQPFNQVTDPAVTALGPWGAEQFVGQSADQEDEPVSEPGSVDDIAWNRDELKRLRELKRKISDTYCALESADKDTQAFYDKKLKMIESQESACVENLKLFNKKRLDAGAAANLVRLEIVPWQGDGTSPVQTWV